MTTVFSHIDNMVSITILLACEAIQGDELQKFAYF